jgi:hypothetical protein
MITTRKATAADGKAWAAEARAAGATVSFHGGTLTVRVAFTPGDVDEFVAAEALAHDAIAEAPTTRNGSVWGTTSDGVGGHIALTSGRFKLKASGVSKRFGAGVLA